jgi:outer membrane protein assembly factor BamD
MIFLLDAVTSFALNVFPQALPVAEGRLLFRRRVKGVLLLVAAFALAILAGCSSTPASKDETAGWSADQLYREAHGAMLDGNYTRAAKLFETLERRFPYGRYAQQAILEGAYADYRSNETDTAIAACDRFIRTYPNHPNVDYALYLKGLIRFREDQGILGYVYELDLSERDPKAMKESYAAFKELVTRFP